MELISPKRNPGMPLEGGKVDFSGKGFKFLKYKVSGFSFMFRVSSLEFRAVFFVAERGQQNYNPTGVPRS